MDYKNLSKYEKLEVMQELNFCRTERHDAAVYLNALRTDNRQIIDLYESFGERPYQFLLNKRTYERGLLFGFMDKSLDEHGWLERPKFIEQERIEFIDRKGWVAMNYITIGRGMNGKWTYGVSYSTGGAGGGYGLDVWGKVFDTRKECLAAALQEIMDRHRENAVRLKNDSANFNAKLSAIVVKQVKEMYDTLTGRRATQLSLIF